MVAPELSRKITGAIVREPTGLRKIGGTRLQSGSFTVRYSEASTGALPPGSYGASPPHASHEEFMGGTPNVSGSSHGEEGGRASLSDTYLADVATLGDADCVVVDEDDWEFAMEVSMAI